MYRTKRRHPVIGQSASCWGTGARDKTGAKSEKVV